MAKKSIYEMGFATGPIMTAPGFPGVQPQLPMPIIPGSAMLPNQQTSQAIEDYLRSKQGTVEYDEQKSLLPIELEQEAMDRSLASPLYAPIKAAMEAQTAGRQGYLKYLKEGEDTDRYLRAAGTIGRGLASLTGDQSYKDIIQAPLTPEQKYADQLKMLADEYTTSGVPKTLVEEYLKTRLTGKTKVTDTRGFETGSKVNTERKEDNLPRAKGGSGSNLKEAIKQNKETSDALLKMKIPEMTVSLQKLGTLIPNAFDEKDASPIPGLNKKFNPGFGKDANWLPDDWSLAGESDTAKQLAAEFEALIIPFRSKEFGATLSGNEKESFNTAVGNVRGAIVDGNAAGTRAALSRLREIIVKKVSELEKGRRLGAQYYQTTEGSGKTRSQQVAEELYGGPVSQDKNIKQAAPKSKNKEALKGL
jgi:hypothetical protein